MTTIKVRRGTAAQWTSANPVLAAGEQGLDTTNNVLKIGDGVTAWSSLGAANSGTYVRLGDVDGLTPVVFAGDSITTTTGFLAYGGPAVLGGFPDAVVGAGTTSTADAGVGGNTSTQLLARYDADVIARAPKVVHILIGTNDASGSATVATLAGNIREMVRRNRVIGARTILGLVPPSSAGSPANRKALIVAYNQWIARYGLTERILVVDYYGPLVDTATGGLASAYDSGDGVHPNDAGQTAFSALILPFIS